MHTVLMFQLLENEMEKFIVFLDRLTNHKTLLWTYQL